MRDLAHSSVERIILPDASILTHYMLRKFTEVIKGLVVYPDRMRANLEQLQGLVMSEHLMLALVEKGMSKDEAYQLIQGIAMKARETGADFRALIAADPTVTKHLTAEELAACFDYQAHLKHLEHIFHRLDL